MPQIQLEAEDYFALLTGLGSNNVKVPRRTLGDDFTAAAKATRALPPPFPYGDLSSVASATAPPVLTGEKARGAYAGGGEWVCGFGDMTSGATPPTASSATAGASGTLPTSQPNAQYGAVVVPVDSSGRRGNPYPFYTDYPDGGRGSFDNAAAQSPPIAIAYDTVDGTQKITVNWSGATGASSYEVYLGVYYYGFRPIQMIATASTSCEFTTGPEDGEAATQDNITPGATVPSTVAMWWYAVSAIMADGETAISAECFGIDRLYVRPLRVQWLPVTGALGYRVYKRGTVGGWTRRFDVPAGSTYFDDDLTNAAAVEIAGLPLPTGQVPCLPVGEVLDKTGFAWQGFVVAGCAIKQLVALYVDGVKVDGGRYGVDVAGPDLTGFSTYFDGRYREVNGRRYTLVYHRGGQESIDLRDGTKKMTAMLKGIEATGDGTGALLTSIYDQYQHFLRNLAARDYQTGNWATSGPTWGDSPNDVDVIDAASFAASKTISAAKYGHADGIPGAFVVGIGEGGTPAQETVRTWIRRLNLSADGYSGFSRKSQFVLKAIDHRAATRDASPRYTAELGILRDSFSITDDPTQIENQITVRAQRHWAEAAWGQETVVQDIDAQGALGEVKPYNLDLWCVQNAGIAYAIGAQRLLRRKYPYRVVRFDVDMGGLTLDLGDIVRASHPFGFGATGWDDRPLFVLRHEFDPFTMKIRIEALDVQYLFEEAVTGNAPAVLMVGTTSLDGSLVEPVFSDPGSAVLLQDDYIVAPF